MRELESMGRDKRTLSARAAERLMELIVGGAFSRGERLPSEFELAEQLEVGRGTIREAIKILVSKSIVAIKRGEGTFVSPNPGRIDDPLGLAFMENKKKLALDLFELRMLIEPPIAALAAARVTDSDIEQLERICVALETHVAAGEAYTADDIAFHEAIAMAAQNQVVTNIIPIIHSAVKMFIDLRDEALTRSTLVSHRAIVDAIRARDPESAMAAMTEHLQRNKSYIDRLPGE